MMKRPTLKQVGTVLLVSVFVTLLSVLFQAYIYFDQGVKAHDRTLEAIEQSYLEPTAAGVFYLERAQLELIARGIVQLPYIRSVTIYERMSGEYHPLVELNRDPGQYEVSQFPLVYSYEGEDRHIGKLAVYSSLDRLWQEVPQKLRRTAIFNLMILAGMALIVLWLTGRMIQLALYDPLTGLPNRRLFRDRLEQATRSSQRTGMQGAVLFVDIDRFKVLNDARGHDAGDQLLAEVGGRIRNHTQEQHTVARMDGDEFGVLLDNLSRKPEEAALQARLAARRIHGTFARGCSVDGVEYRATASIGVSVFVGSEASASTVLKQADLAMMWAKQSGGGNLRFFDPKVQSSLEERVVLETDLRSALSREQLILHYQPQMDSHGRTLGAEALLRWKHPTRGLVSPGTFIPLAEASGLIEPLGRWALNAACRQLRAWSKDPATRDLRLAVNVSAREFRQESFVAHIERVLDETGAIPSCLKLELTETVVVQDVSDSLRKMQALQQMGIGFAIDDFGTGYSSLAYLTRLPLDALKIDRSFVLKLPESHRDAVVTQTIIALAKTLGLEVIAEGVETEAQRRFLLGHHCHVFQGYLFSEALPLAEFERYYAAQQKRGRRD